MEYDSNDNPGNKKAPDSSRNAGNPERGQQVFHAGERIMLRKRIFKRIRNVSIKKLIRRSLRRGRKWWWLHVTSHSSSEKHPVFIGGCNRSGTNMVCSAIGNSSYGWDYRESIFSIAFKGYYLRTDRTIEWLIRWTPAPIISFGSILDSQSIDYLLSRFQGAKGIWVYRRYQDVANSCARMQWGYHLKDLGRWVARGELERLGARGKRISAETVRLFGKLFHEDISNEDSACLYWYMRNQLFFDLNLHIDPRVLIVQYEDSVLNPEKAFRRIFRFLGFPFDSAIVTEVFASSVNKYPRPTIDTGINEICDGLTARLDTHYAKTSDWKPEPDNHPQLPIDIYKI